jgi:hypothetical protein
MKTDAAYAMGASHHVCQDYALAGQVGGNLWVGLVADGCSSSADSDSGARLLARTALTAIQHGAGPHFLDVALPHAKRLADELILPNEALDATLCGWLVDGETAHGFIFGDGVLFYQTTETVILHATQPHNAPQYASYRLSPGRAADHTKRYGAETEILEIRDGKPGPILSITDAYRISLPVAQVKTLGAFSDGITSIAGPNGKIPLLDAVGSLTKFSQPEGGFFARRLRRQLRDWAKTQNSPADDISGAILLP